jgi:hypothetical protein
LLVLWFIARGRNDDEPVPSWLLLVLLVLLVSIGLIFFGNFPVWLIVILALIWLVVLLWLWLIYRERKWRTSNTSWLLIFLFILLVLSWWLYFNFWWTYLLWVLAFLLLIGLAAWYLYLYGNPLWGVIVIVDRRKRILWSAPLAGRERSDGRSYYHWKFDEPVGPVRRLRIHSWDRLKHWLVLTVTLTEGQWIEEKVAFKRSLENWQDCDLEDGFRIVWLEEIPKPKPRPKPKRAKPKPPKSKPGSAGKTRTTKKAAPRRARK